MMCLSMSSPILLEVQRQNGTGLALFTHNAVDSRDVEGYCYGVAEKLPENGSTVQSLTTEATNVTLQCDLLRMCWSLTERRPILLLV